MLVLSRKQFEKLVFTLKEPLPAGEEFSITVVEIRGNKVRLGFVGNKTIGVARHETLAPLSRQVSQLKAGAT